MKKTLLALPLVAALALTGCSNMTTTQQRELSGGAIGAAAGAGITAIAGGNTSTTTALGRSKLQRVSTLPRMRS